MKHEARWMVASLALTLGACGDSEGGGGSGTGGSSTTSTAGSPTSSAGTTMGSGLGGTGPSGSGGDPGGSGGAGGTPDLDKDPATVTESEDCYYEGGGGANGWGCFAASIVFSASVPRAELTFRVETDEGDVFETGDDINDPPSMMIDGEGADAEGLNLMYEPRGHESNEHYDPEWLDVEVRRNDVLVGAERIYPEYACVAHSQDDWCWESPPVTLEITNPE